MRASQRFTIPFDFSIRQLILWADRFDVAAVLNSNRREQTFQDRYGRFDYLVAVGSSATLKAGKDAIDGIQIQIDNSQDWGFGFLTYDLKNEIEKLESKNPDGLEWPTAHFFTPRFVITIQENELVVFYNQEEQAPEQIKLLVSELFQTVISNSAEQPPLTISSRTTKEEYIRNVRNIQQHILRGDIYEMNYCVEFFAEEARIDPAQMFLKLNERSPMPFSCYYKMKGNFLMCASPERFLAKRGSKIISQPIKGTAKRGATMEEDARIKTMLSKDPKEQAENVMIVDLVRNDLSRTALRGSVQVEELFGVYTFSRLHQMISTITSEIKPGAKIMEVVKAAFPMGSMTGAPKIRAMQLIEEFESVKRGLYSGSVFYVDPDGNADFNVVIRSIQYNSSSRYLSYIVGSAITANSIPEKEYDECLLKAESMMQVTLSKQERNSTGQLNNL